MARVDDLPLPYRLFVRTYPWRRVDPVPWAALSKPLASCRVAVVSSAGFVAPGQAPFDDGVRGGDWSFREIPAETDVRTLVSRHRSEAWDRSGIARDANLAFPIDRMRELAAEGRIGSIASRHLSFMGSITAPGRLIRESAPKGAALLVADRVDVALLVPV
ncbi:MAG TPA: glycine/sarcosine/betaine reductase selenoprotein B family protein [Candidatus Polarisedimenticolaceae bacterium]